MEDNKDRIFLMKEGKISKSLLILGIPSMVGMVINALYNLIDAFFVGQLGKEQMAAVAIIYPLSLLVLGIGLLFGSGAASFLSRLLGKGQYEKANECASTALFSSLIMGSLLLLLFLFFIHPLLYFLGATNTTYPYAYSYGSIFILSLFISLFTITMNNLIVAEGATQISMLSLIIGGVSNILLDPLFIFGLHLGVMGAALATLVAKLLSLIVYVLFLVQGKSQFHFSFRRFKPSPYIYKQILQIGFPLLFFQLLTSLSLSITNNMASVYGEAAIAAIAIVTRLLSLFSMAIFGFLKGYQPLVGYNYGAKNYLRVNQSTKTVLRWANLFCLITGLAMIFGARPLIAFFCDYDLSVTTIGSHALILYATTYIGFGFSAVYANYFLAIGKAKEAGCISIGRQGLFFIPSILVLNHIFGLTGLIFAQPLADILSILLVLALVHRYNLQTPILKTANYSH